MGNAAAATSEQIVNFGNETDDQLWLLLCEVSGSGWTK